MDAVYDELISENPFFITFKNDLSNLYQHCITESWVICVPRVGSLSTRTFTAEDFCAHILVPSEELPESHFTTLTEKSVTVLNKVITVDINYAGIPLQSHILFEETFYTEDLIKFKVWCIETPLEPAVIGQSPPITSYEQLLGINDCINLLWTQSAGRQVLEQIELCIKAFLNRNSTLPTSIGALSDAIGQLYTSCSQIAFQNRRLREKSKQCKQMMETIKLAVESYMQQLIFQAIFKPICTCAAYEDSRLNKIIRNLADIQLRDLDIRKDVYDTVPKAKKILSKINTYNTVLEKVICLKDALNAISRKEQDGKVVMLTADDLLPVLVFLVIKTGLPNWYSQLIYMKEFRFSARAKGIADETAFLITTLEAVIEHIRSGELIGSPNPESYYYENDPKNEHSISTAKRRNSTTESTSTGDYSCDDTLDRLFELIKASHYDHFKEILEKNQKVMEETDEEVNQALDIAEELDELLNEEDDEESPPALCHPLCSCRKCCRAISKSLLRTSPTVWSRDSHGLTTLHIASIHGKTDIVELLLTMRAEIDATDLNESTALHYAASRGHQNALLLLIHSGANINKVNIDMNTPLHLASNNGHLSCVKALIYFAEHCRQTLQINYANDSGDTPLHLASKWGYEGIAKILIENGAEPSLQNKKNNTSFDYAHNLRILRILQSCSPNLYEFIHITSTDVTALKVNKAVAKKDNIDCRDANVNKSFENMKRIEKTLRAISYGDVKLACFFMEMPYPLNKNHSNIPHSKSKILCHPLCECVKCTQVESSTKISKFDVNFSDAGGHTALHYASRYGLHELCEILLQNEANVNSVSKNGQTPLHLAALNNKVATMQLLLERGADINAANVAGDTPLHDASSMGNIGAVKVLLKFNPEACAKNGLEKTPLDIAKDKVYLTVIDLIEKYIMENGEYKT